MSKKVQNMSIKKKVRLGCIVLAAILFFSTLISILEYVKMNNYVSEVITDNIRSINTSKEMLSVAEQHNISLMNSLVMNDEALSLDFGNQDDLISSFSDLKKKFVTPAERASADSVLYAYAAYMQIVSEAETVWQSDFDARKEWFFNRLQPVYLSMRGYMMDLTAVCQDALVRNSQNLQEGFQRSLMPGMIAVLVGLVMVFLFFYYLNYYIINPILKVNKGFRNSNLYGKAYDVRLDSDDEIQELNTMVSDIIDLKDSYKKQLEQQ